ncbi:hypothetical protein [Streptomyces asoensis]|uniref:Uncharacterized protein n=1 Tax=Streptomyces asoensis TaxID=249586 RepID=A0ABQ3RX76_9ACTN|nr:hypothetical protein [Streptomyces asoensis]GGQ52690.1 hypothetical protein GCM10010496_13700 [Streptomyces asoensis]GHI60461.1 hypothetical protein Saso_21110 [Streptomyces asoensis]
MGSSYMDYREQGFWARDFQAEVWLFLLSEEAARLTGRPDWLDAARSDWHLQATAGFTGFVSPCLDEHLGTAPDRVATVLALSLRLRERLLRWAPAIPRDVVNGFGTGGHGSSFGRDLDTDVLLKFADAFEALLRGEITGGPGTVEAY